MRRAARVDRNHAEVRDGLRAAGAFVIDTHGLPGCLDLLVGWRGRFVLVEVKDGSKPASARVLTADEKLTVDLCRIHGLPCAVVTSLADALAAVGA